MVSSSGPPGRLLSAGGLAEEGRAFDAAAGSVGVSSEGRQGAALVAQRPALAATADTVMSGGLQRLGGEQRQVCDLLAVALDLGIAAPELLSARTSRSDHAALTDERTNLFQVRLHFVHRESCVSDAAVSG